MAAIARVIVDRYENILHGYKDPRVEEWPLMESPWPTLAMVGMYLLTVVVIGPSIMANRKPFQLKNVLIVYNAFQVIYSSIMLYEHLASGWWFDYSYRCQPVDYSRSAKAMRMTNLCWWYYISKLTEFCDTVFFVLRKKDNQISLLHLYHHSLTPLETWVCCKFLAGSGYFGTCSEEHPNVTSLVKNILTAMCGHGTFSNLINNGVHVIMYFYYMMSAMGPQYQKYLWWKKYLTTIQLTQFTLVFFHSLQALFCDCGYPKLIATFLLFHSTIFFVLFYDFYQQAYRAQKAQKAVKAE